MNKTHHRMFKVVSESVTFGDGTIGFIKKRGQVILNLLDIESVFKVDGEDSVEIVMRKGDRFKVRNIDIGDLFITLDRIKVEK